MIIPKEKERKEKKLKEQKTKQKQKMHQMNMMVFKKRRIRKCRSVRAQIQWLLR